MLDNLWLMNLVGVTLHYLRYSFLDFKSWPAHTAGGRRRRGNPHLLLKEFPLEGKRRYFSPWSLVSGERIGREGALARLGVGVGVDNPEDSGCAHAKEPHVKHAHVPQELSDPRAGSTEGATGVFSAVATSWEATKAQAHTLCLRHQQADQVEGDKGGGHKSCRQHYV